MGLPVTSAIRSLFSRYSFISEIIFLVAASLSLLFWLISLFVILNLSGIKCLKLSSSSLHLRSFIPIFCARGACIERVSLAIFFLFSGSKNFRVSTLCNLSASFIIITLTSFATDTKNLRMFFSSKFFIRVSSSTVSFVRDITISDISLPNFSSISTDPKSVSSITS